MKLKAAHVFCAAVLLFFAARLMAPRFVRSRPPPAPPVEFDDSDLRPVRVPLPAESNAFFVLARATNRLRWPQDQADLIHATLRGDRWEDAQVAGWLRGEPGVGQWLDEALARPRVQAPVQQDITENPSHADDWRNFGSLVLLQANASFREGREQEALDLLVKLLEFGHRLEASEGGFDEYLAGASVKKGALRHLRQLTVRTALPAARLKELLPKLAQFRTDTAVLSNTFKLDYWQRACAIEGLRQGRLPGETRVNPWFKPEQVNMLNADETKRLFAAGARAGLRAIPEPMTHATFEGLPSVPEKSSQFARLVSGNYVGETVFHQFASHPSALIRAKVEENTALGATQLVLALRSWQADHGELPESLAALVPEYLPGVPLDDYDGQPFRYLRDKRMVYSVGPNLVDDGGRTNRFGAGPLDVAYELGR